jgi:hypothetical protein
LDATYGGDNASKPELIVEGTLIAEGLPGQEITFTSSRGVQSQKGDWLGIDVTGTLRMKHAVVEYGSYGIKYTPGSVDQGTSELIIENSIIRDTGGHAIDLYFYNTNGLVEPVIRNNVIERNNGAGVYSSSIGSTTTTNIEVCGNTISDNLEAAIYCSAESAAVLIGNICNNILSSSSATYGIHGYTATSAESQLTMTNNTVNSFDTGIYTHYYSNVSLSSTLNIRQYHSILHHRC